MAILLTKINQAPEQLHDGKQQAASFCRQMLTKYPKRSYGKEGTHTRPAKMK